MLSQIYAKIKSLRIVFYSREIILYCIVLYASFINKYVFWNIVVCVLWADSFVSILSQYLPVTSLG